MELKLGIATAGFTLSVAVMGVKPAQAFDFTYTNTTIGQPTWTRPFVANEVNIPTLPSGIGTVASYSTFEFKVDTKGLYNFLSIATNPTEWDNYLFLYTDSFNPNNPLLNAVIGNDDFPKRGRSGFNNVSLTTDKNYFLVTTGYFDASQGVFENTISGSGKVVKTVPEPPIILGSAIAMVMGWLIKRFSKACQSA
ncbi:PEP-CTERM sorting domain-containing protein [Nostoc sp. 'Peltigera membranacea cyanobiont' N6]|uniref:PEP-CTERM sorting domain-containing protein n=1 Tax=Nostoc sp. 'Peltigera membranacea cyanobiont' N6 TaxID=1261031 RepID=UPI000CF30F81|nr:PEP-CTERM sorting domain-containing protein [Nostoc sp. 'Peltigera membranacea cyanobiont' N6]AVH66471.1 PEP-CTERM protein sorting domain-containing protein [Nostoc sp. 'Peltigera membranacea cyanobiont' N6]